MSPPPDDSSSTMIFGEANDALEQFLEQCHEDVQRSSSSLLRVTCDCCGASRSMYCFHCCHLLIPLDQQPRPVRMGTIQLPFDVDILLDDRRASSTSVQLKTLIDACRRNHHNNNNNNGNTPKQKYTSEIRLFDMALNEEIPNYTNCEYTEGTYVLFPGPTSQSLAHIMRESGTEGRPTRIQRLVVLDCKWSRSSIRFHKSIQGLPCLHLSPDQGTPIQSNYWRWHNAGPGMLSSVEAIYFCAWYVASIDSHHWTKDERNNLVSIMWLFGLHRGIIAKRYREKSVQTTTCIGAKNVGEGSTLILPFTEEYKSSSRALRYLHTHTNTNRKCQNKTKK